MILIVLGLLAGALVASTAALGPGPVAAADWLFTATAELGHGIGTSLAGLLISDSSVATGIGAVVGVLSPGLVVLVLVEACLAGRALRRLTSLALLVAAGVSVVYLSAGQAVAVAALAVLLAVLLWSAAGSILMAVVAAATGFLAVRLVFVIFGGDLDSVHAAAQEVRPLLDLGAHGAVVLAAFALVPVAAAVGRLAQRLSLTD